MPQRVHTVELTERELRVILSAFDYATESGPEWWTVTKYVRRLYDRLLTLGH